MENIKFFLKFGKKEHLESLVDNNLYCSNAITFWGIEDELKIKGQGDILEASTKMFAQKITMLDPQTNEIIAEGGRTSGLVRVEPAKKIPVFCMFAVYEEDCKIDDNGELVVDLSDEKKQTIYEHFPDADAVVVIPNPDKFINDIKRSIGFDIKAENVHYFHIDEGFDTKFGQTAMDMEYMKYLMQDVPPIRCNGKIKYTFCADYAYRVLFCKDVFFRNEQEYRIVLPTESIDKGTKYPVKLSTKYKIFDLDNFFRDK